MKAIVILLTILLGYKFALAQKVDEKVESHRNDPDEISETSGKADAFELKDLKAVFEPAPVIAPTRIEESDGKIKDGLLIDYKDNELRMAFLKKIEPLSEIDPDKLAEDEFEELPTGPPPKEPDGAKDPKKEDKFHWKPALIQSGYFLAIQHGLRLFQKKTRDQLGGPFFRDWLESVKNLRGWDDGDNIFTNYFAHPMQGTVTGRIFINNSDKGKRQEFGKSKEYWESRFKAMAWAAVWSTQFELGPVSEANIGNVGKRTYRGRSTMAWVDLVVTPVGGTGVLIFEDMIDKYILKNWLEKKLTSRTRMKIYRTFFTPLISFTNVLRGRVPWARDNRCC
ncbi:MAG: hypothetical protein R2747_11715 [Pyrinomonadaceae bacterium]